MIPFVLVMVLELAVAVWVLTCAASCMGISGHLGVEAPK